MGRAQRHGSDARTSERGLESQGPADVTASYDGSTEPERNSENGPTREFVEISLLESKCRPPRPRTGAMARSRLTELLDRGADSKSTLISAPAGSGKSTLLAEWIAPAPEPGARAWLGLEPFDNDVHRFWTYVIAALRTAAPPVGGDTLRLLDERQPF